MTNTNIYKNLKPIFNIIDYCNNNKYYYEDSHYINNSFDKELGILRDLLSPEYKPLINDLLYKKFCLVVEDEKEINKTDLNGSIIYNSYGQKETEFVIEYELVETNYLLSEIIINFLLFVLKVRLLNTTEKKTRLISNGFLTGYCSLRYEYDERLKKQLCLIKNFINTKDNYSIKTNKKENLDSLLKNVRSINPDNRVLLDYYMEGTQEELQPETKFTFAHFLDRINEWETIGESLRLIVSVPIELIKDSILLTILVGNYLISLIDDLFMVLAILNIIALGISLLFACFSGFIQLTNIDVSNIQASVLEHLTNPRNSSLAVSLSVAFSLSLIAIVQAKEKVIIPFQNNVETFLNDKLLIKLDK